MAAWINRLPLPTEICMFRFVPLFIQIAVYRQYFWHHLGAGESNYIFRLSQGPFMFMPLTTLFSWLHGCYWSCYIARCREEADLLLSLPESTGLSWILGLANLFKLSCFRERKQWTFSLLLYTSSSSQHLKVLKLLRVSYGISSNDFKSNFSLIPTVQNRQTHSIAPK